jgi:predicted HicB family RNase H-like nuclease
MDQDDVLDGTEELTINLEKELLYKLMLVAHEQDITLNQLIEEILIDYIEKHKNLKRD